MKTTNELFTTEYEGREIIFDIVERNGKERTLISRDILCFEPFDIKGSNNYSRSSIKRVLNDEFKQRFNKDFINNLQGKFFLPSEDEIKAWYPKMEDRIKKYKSEPYWYWVRTPHAFYSRGVRLVSTDGSLSNDYAYCACGIAVACKIILE